MGATEAYLPATPHSSRCRPPSSALPQPDPEPATLDCPRGRAPRVPSSSPPGETSPSGIAARRQVGAAHGAARRVGTDGLPDQPAPPSPRSGRVPPGPCWAIGARSRRTRPPLPPNRVHMIYDPVCRGVRSVWGGQQRRRPRVDLGVLPRNVEEPLLLPPHRPARPLVPFLRLGRLRRVRGSSSAAETRRPTYNDTWTFNGYGVDPARDVGRPSSDHDRPHCL